MLEPPNNLALKGQHYAHGIIHQQHYSCVDTKSRHQDRHQSSFSAHSTMTLKLYGHPASLCTRRVLLVLAEKGIEYEFVNVDFMAGEQKVNFSNLTSLAAL